MEYKQVPSQTMTATAINEAVGTILTTETLRHFAGREVAIRHIVQNLSEGGVYVIFQQAQRPEKCLKITQSQWDAHDPILETGKCYKVTAFGFILI